MGCIYCGEDGTHLPRCPLWIPPKADYYCSICNEGIFSNEEYIRNYNDEYVHTDCVPDTGWLIDWLGGERRTME